MKIILFIILSVISISNTITIEELGLPESVIAQAKLLHKVCVKETKVHEVLIKQSVNGFIPNDRNLHCYINCLFDKTGLIDEKGVYHLEHLLDMLPPETKEVLDKILSVCITIHGSDPCETAYLTVKCYFEAAPEHAMLI